MQKSDSTRRISAILMADVAGYSRLIGQDVEFTVQALRACQEIFGRIAAQHQGRVVNAPGDSILVEFGTVVDALQAAAEIQEELHARNMPLPTERQMHFRIGISQGHVVVDEGAIYGDEVNIAARLESIAEPDGICISSIAHHEVEGKLAFQFEFLGEQLLKNIERAVPVYRVWFREDSAPPPAVSPLASHLIKPSIAVLPFTVFGGDPEQEYFADGITEDIITELSRFKALLVIARNSTFVYKGKAVSVRQVARDLGVQYVLEGSVRKAGNRVRITAQLVDGSEGTHLWAERYDRELEDVFQIQDEIGQMIVAAIPRRVEKAGLDRAKRKTTENLAAYDFLLRGKDHHHKRTAEDNAQALAMLDRAIELDPDFAQAHAWKACTLGQALARGYQPRTEENLSKAFTTAEHSKNLDDDDSESHRILCEVYLYQSRFEEAEYHHERAIALNPNDPRIVAQRGQLMTWTGRAQEGVSWIELARRVDPYPPDARADSLGLALFFSERFAEGARAYRKIGNPSVGNVADLAACLAMAEQPEQAAEQAARVREKEPEFSVEAYLKDLPYKNDTDRERHAEGLRKAGLS